MRLLFAAVKWENFHYFFFKEKNKVRESIFLLVIIPILMPLFTVPSATCLTMIVIMWWMKLKMKKLCDGNFFFT